MKPSTELSEPPDVTMESTRRPLPRAGTSSTASSARGSRRPGRRGTRSPSPSGVRYFVGRPGDPDAKPTLEQEVASEPEALVIAFKSDKRVYFITEYRVTQKIEGGQVRLEKEPAASATGHAAVPKGVSTTNES